MSHVIVLVAPAGYGPPPPERNAPQGAWLKSFEDTPDGRGCVVWTLDFKNAMRFATGGDALDFWNQQSKTVPIRPDGKPNKPLTAYRVEIVRA